MVFNGKSMCKNVLRIMDISERVLFSELAQMLSKELQCKSVKKYSPKTFSPTVDPNQPPPEYFQQQEQAQMGLVKGGAIATQKIDQLSILEKEIIRILLLFGNETVDFIEDVPSVDEDGTRNFCQEKISKCS